MCAAVVYPIYPRNGNRISSAVAHQVEVVGAHICVFIGMSSG